MTIDTTGKKLSLLNYMRTDMIILPPSTGGISEGDKLHLLNLYSFGLGEAEVPFSHILLFLLNINRLNVCLLSINRLNALILKLERIITFDLER